MWYKQIGHIFLRGSKTSVGFNRKSTNERSRLNELESKVEKCFIKREFGDLLDLRLRYSASLSRTSCLKFRLLRMNLFISVYFIKSSLRVGLKCVISHCNKIKKWALENTLDLKDD